MALSDTELAKVRQDLLETGGIFSSPIPITAEEMNKYIKTDAGLNEILVFTQALYENKKINSIDNIFKYAGQIIDPALEDKKKEALIKKAEIIAKFGKYKSGILASASEMKNKKMKHQAELQKVVGQAKINAAKEGLVATKEQKEILESKIKELNAELKEVNQQTWSEFFKSMSGQLDVRSGEFKQQSRQAAIFGAKTLSHIPAAADQFAKNFQALALNARNMAVRKYEDAPKAFDEFKKSFLEAVKNTLSAAAKFLHQVKKALDPLRSLHHERKENAAFRANFLTYVEGQAKSTTSMEERLVRSDAVSASSLSGDIVTALELQKTQTPSEIAAIQQAEAKAAAEVAKQKAEFEALTERNKDIYNKFMEEDDLVAKRLDEDKAIADKPKGVYDATKKKAEELLRGKNVVEGLRGRASSAYSTERTDSPESASNAKGRSNPLRK